MSARRSKAKRDWPRGLYEPRDGYFTWRHPDGRLFTLGRIPLADAINEALAANRYVLDTKPDLVARLSGADHTVAETMDRMPAPASAETKRAYASYDRLIRERLGHRRWCDLTVTDCAELVNEKVDAGRAHAAKYLRSRLRNICAKAVALGWAETNAADVTESVTPAVARRRLTLDHFRAILAAAPQVAEWLPRAMLLAVVTGQDRSTICAMRHEHIADGALTVWRSKTRRTNQPVAIPLDLRLQALDVSLRDLVNAPTGVRSKYLLHHVTPRTRARAGAPVPADTVTNAFAQARDLAGLGGENPPTFHELRSLCKRLYERQGGVDTRALLGHNSASTAAVYADPRGAEPIVVRIDVNAK